MLCSRPPQAGHLKPSGHRDATTTARHCSSLPYCRSNAGSLSPFWNCTALRAISIPPPKALVCSWFVPYPGRLSKVRNQERLCLRHRLLPSLVGRPPRPECRVPSLRRRYPASTVLRTRPPLCLASVLGSSGVCPLEVSLGIEATGSHVPHKSLSLVSRRLHAGRRSASRQASAELCRRPTTGAWFWRRPYAFDTSATVHSRSSDQRTPDGIAPAFCRNAHHPGHWTDAACGGLDPDPAIRARGADPHLLCSKAARS